MSSRTAPRATRSRGIITRLATDDVVPRTSTTTTAGPSRAAATRTRSVAATLSTRTAVTSPPRKAPTSPRRRNAGVKPTRANPLDFRPRSPPHAPRPAAPAAAVATENAAAGPAWAAQLQVSLRKEASARTGRETERHKSVIERALHRTRVGKRAERELRSSSREKEVEKIVSPVRERGEVMVRRNTEERRREEEKVGKGDSKRLDQAGGREAGTSAAAAALSAQGDLSSVIVTSTVQRTLEQATEPIEAPIVATAAMTSPIVESSRTPAGNEDDYEEDLPELQPSQPIEEEPVAPAPASSPPPPPASSQAAEEPLAPALEASQARRACSELHNQGMQGQSQFEDAASVDEDDVMAFSSSQAVPGYSQQRQSIQGSHQRARLHSRAASNASSTRPLKRARIAGASDENGRRSGGTSQLADMQEEEAEVENSKPSDGTSFELSSQAQRQVALPMQSSNLGPRRADSRVVRIAAAAPSASSSQASSPRESQANSLGSVASVSLMRTGTTQLPPGALFPFWDFDRGQSQAFGLGVGVDSETQSEEDDEADAQMDVPEPSLAELMRPTVRAQKEAQVPAPAPESPMQTRMLAPATPEVARAAAQESSQQIVTPAPPARIKAHTKRILALDTPIAAPAPPAATPVAPVARQAWLLAKAPPSRASVCAWLNHDKAEPETRQASEQRHEAFAQAWKDARRCDVEVSGSQSIIDDGARAVPAVVWRGRECIDAYFPARLPAYTPRSAPPSRAEVTGWVASHSTASSPPAPAQRAHASRRSANTTFGATTFEHTRDSLFDSRVAANVPWDDSLVWRGSASLVEGNSELSVLST